MKTTPSPERGPLLNRLIAAHLVRIMNNAYLCRLNYSDSSAEEYPLGMIGEEDIIETFLLKDEVDLVLPDCTPIDGVISRIRLVCRQHKCGLLPTKETLNKLSELVERLESLQ